MMKVAIIGYSGSGKSTLAREIGVVNDIPVLHLDTVQFLPNWQVKEDKEAFKEVSDFMAREQWIIEGNYTRYHQAQRLEEATWIIWLKFSRWACLKRVIKRYIKYQGTTRPDMAKGCEEKLDWEFITWVLYKGRTRDKQQHYQNIVNRYPDKMTIIKNQRQLNKIKNVMLKH